MNDLLKYLPTPEQLQEEEAKRREMRMTGDIMSSMLNTPSGAEIFLGRERRGPDYSAMGKAAAEEVGAGRKGAVDVLAKYQQLQSDSPQEKERLARLQSDLALARDKEIETLRGENRIREIQARTKSGLVERVDPATGDVSLVPAKKYSPAQTAVDKKFGEDYADYVTLGGWATADQNLKLVGDVIEKLRSKQVSSGGASSYLGENARTFLNPELQKTIEDARTAVMGSLRQTYGPQFTEKEGEKYFQASFNPKLPVEQNIEKLSVMLKRLQNAAAAKQAAIEYFEQNDTMAGFKGGQPNIATGASQNQQPGKTVSAEDEAAIAWAKKNPNDPRSAQILKLHGM